jgi:hypothetical protein
MTNIQQSIAQFKADTLEAMNEDIWEQMKSWVSENIEEDDYSTVLDEMSNEFSGELTWKN